MVAIVLNRCSVAVRDGRVRVTIDPLPTAAMIIMPAQQHKVRAGKCRGTNPDGNSNKGC